MCGMLVVSMLVCCQHCQEICVSGKKPAMWANSVLACCHCLQELRGAFAHVCSSAANCRQTSVAVPAQRLSAEVLGSSHVQQALALLAAYDAGNFVRFFKLMRSMPYLMACIAHRLVPATRHRALRIWVNGARNAR